jgi:hypothetical protein
MKKRWVTHSNTSNSFPELSNESTEDRNKRLDEHYKNLKIQAHKNFAANDKRFQKHVDNGYPDGDDR